MFVNTADQVGVKLSKIDSGQIRAEGEKGEFVAKSVVPEVGFEPTRGCPHRFLSLTTPVFQRPHTTTNVHFLVMR